jgi:hypothetical protein
LKVISRTLFEWLLGVIKCELEMSDLTVQELLGNSLVD